MGKYIKSYATSPKSIFPQEKEGYLTAKSQFAICNLPQNPVNDAKFAPFIDPLYIMLSDA